MNITTWVKRAIIVSAISAQSAMAGNIVLTGHDVLLHSGQNGFDDVILDYLADGQDQTLMDMVVIGSGVGFWDFSSTTSNVHAGYNSTTYYDTDLMSAADWTNALLSDVFVYLSHTSCGGCDTSTAGVAAVNAQAANIVTAFNGGMNIWANSAGSNADYYNFLPAGIAVSGTSISGSSGFTTTAAGTGIGILSTHINGFPTHNRFSSQAAAFTVLEERGTEVITIGLKGGAIDGGGITTSVPEPETLALFGLSLIGLSFSRRKNS